MSVPFLARFSVAAFVLAVCSTALIAQEQQQTAASPQPPGAQEPPRVQEAGAEPLACPFCDFRNQDLSGKNFTDANLQSADFSGANLSDAVFNGAALSGANFTGANLTNASFNTTSVGGADLSAANLTDADLQGARMNGTDLQFAMVSGTNFGGVDLSSATIGLVLRVGTTGIGRTNLRGARLRRDVHIDPAHAELTDFVRVDPPAPRGRANAATVYPWVCGAADLSQLTSVVYVKPEGSDGKQCGKSSETPCATIAAGINGCAAIGCGVLVYWGQYDATSTIRMRDGVSVYGGCVSGGSSNDYMSSVHARWGERPVLLKASSINRPTVIQNLALYGSSAQGDKSDPSIVLTVSDSSGLSFIDSNLYGGVAARGKDGGRASSGDKGGYGNNGSGISSTPRGLGGTSPCGGTAGGAGGVPMFIRVDEKWGCLAYCAPMFSLNNTSPCGGQNGEGAAGKSGWGGSAGDANKYKSDCKRDATGKPGFPGGDGDCGSGSTQLEEGYRPGYFYGDVWYGASVNGAKPGGNGGGGGGGGGGGYTCGACSKSSNPGSNGGGGGGGGCGGAAGESGEMGGPSFTILASSSSVSLHGCRIVGGSGGPGGAGGAGGNGGAGGAGGAGGSDLGGGFGGGGGSGGHGGGGGGGAGGPGGPSILFAIRNDSSWSDSSTIWQIGASGTPGVGAPGGSSGPLSRCTDRTGQHGSKTLAAKSFRY